jgi:hypothetical protein
MKYWTYEKTLAKASLCLMQEGIGKNPQSMVDMVKRVLRQLW